MRLTGVRRTLSGGRRHSIDLNNMIATIHDKFAEGGGPFNVTGVRSFSNACRVTLFNSS